MAHLFLSYHYSAVDQAYALQAALDDSGYATWINADPQAGENWLPWVQLGLEQAWGVLLLLDPLAAASPYLTYEWAFALGDGRPVVPVRIAPCALHPMLEACDPIDFAEAGLPPILDRLNTLARPFCLLPPLAQTPSEPMAAVLRDVCAAQPAARRAALSSLSGSDDPAATEALVRALGHPVYRDVRLGAIDALRGRPDPEVIAGLVGALSDPDLAVTRAASEALAAAGPAAIPALQAALSHERRDVRRAAVLALANIDDRVAVPALIDALLVRDWHVSRSAAVALGKQGDPRAIPALAAVLRHEDPHLAAEAERALLRIGTTEALRTLAGSTS